MEQEYLWLQNYMIISKVYNFLSNKFSNKIGFEDLINFYFNSTDLKKQNIKLSLFLNSSDFSNDDLNFISYHLNEYLKSKTVINSFNRFWVNKLNSLKTKKVDLIFFKCYQILIFLGLYDLALIYRKLFAEKCLNSDNQVLRARSRIEIGDLKKPFKLKNRTILYNSYRDLIFKNKNSFSRNLRFESDKNDSKLFTQKNIIVIGPLYSGNYSFEEYDTIIFIKSQPKEVLSKCSKKNIIIYFNSSNIRNKNFKKFYDEYFNLINLFKVKDWVDYDKCKLINKNPFLLSGGPMMLQNILFDIIIKNPSKIYISGFNFYCSDKMYNDDYQSIKWYDDIFYVRRSFALHDLISNFLFVKNIYKNKLIESDDLGNEVLNLDVDEYFTRIKKFY